MKTREQLSDERQLAANNYQSALMRLIAGIQSAMAVSIIDEIIGLDTDADGLIKNTVRNTLTASQVGLRVDFVLAERRRGILGFILRGIRKILGLNAAYFKTIKSYSAETVDAAVLRKTMLRLGYDVLTDKVLGGSWIDNLLGARSVKVQVMSAVSQAVAARLPLNTFRLQFKQAFTAPGGLGYLERHYNTFAHDLFQGIDRSAGAEYSEKLALRYFLYSGSIMAPNKKSKGTRPFCAENVNRLFHISIFDTWAAKTWAGKNPHVPVSISLGGYNCRHHINYISDELAEVLWLEQYGEEAPHLQPLTQ